MDLKQDADGAEKQEERGERWRGHQVLYQHDAFFDTFNIASLSHSLIHLNVSPCLATESPHGRSRVTPRSLRYREPQGL